MNKFNFKTTVYIALAMCFVFACNHPGTSTDDEVEKLSICYTDADLEDALQFVNSHSNFQNKEYYQYLNYDIYTKDATIFLTKEGYTLAKINKEIGVVALTKYKNDYDRIMQDIDQIFTHILYETE